MEWMRAGDSDVGVVAKRKEAQRKEKEEQNSEAIGQLDVWTLAKPDDSFFSFFWMWFFWRFALGRVF